MFSSIWGCIYIYICLFYYSAAYLVRGLRRSLSLTVEATTQNANIWMLLMKGESGRFVPTDVSYRDDSYPKFQHQ